MHIDIDIFQSKEKKGRQRLCNVYLRIIDVDVTHTKWGVFIYSYIHLYYVVSIYR